MELLQPIADEQVVKLLFTYAAEQGSRSDEARKLLASWAATPDRADADAFVATDRR